MNIVFGLRGERYLQQQICDQLSTTWFNQIKKKDGKVTIDKVSRCLQPINFYSLAVPKEYANQIFTSLKFNEDDRYIYGNLKSKIAFAGMRKAMGLKPIPKFKQCEEKYRLPLPDTLMNYMQVIPIGIKEDVMGVDEDGFEKEMI